MREVGLPDWLSYPPMTLLPRAIDLAAKPGSDREVLNLNLIKRMKEKMNCLN